MTGDTETQPKANRTVLVVGVLLGLPLFIFLAIAFKFDPKEFKSPLIGKEAPDFALQDLDGNRVDIAQFAGRPVVLNFWATWCGPCKYEHPLLVQASKQLGERVGWVGVVYQDEPEKIRSYLAKHGSWGHNLVDTESKVSIAYGVYGVPETYFIDREGKVSYKHVGPLDYDTLYSKLEELL